MAVDTEALKNKAVATLKGFSVSQLVIISLLSVLGITGAVFFMKWVSTPSYGVLLSGLDPKDAASVTAKLQSDGVAYKLASGGTTVAGGIAHPSRGLGATWRRALLQVIEGSRA